MIVFNIRSLMNKYDQLKVLLSKLDIVILCLSEHWLKDSDIVNVNFDRQLLISSYCRSDKCGGGVAIWIRGDIGATLLDMRRFCSSNLDVCGATVKTKRNKANLVVINLYRPPQGNLEVFQASMQEIVDNFCKPEDNFIIAGDFNIDFSSQDNKHAILLVQLMCSYGLTSYVKQYTRVTPTSSTIIDNVFANNAITESFLHNTYLFGHKCLEIRLQNMFVANEQFNSRRIFSIQNKNGFKKRLTEEDWGQLTKEELSVHKAYDIFIGKLNYMYNLAFPIKRVKIQEQNNSPWITDKLKSNLQKLNDLKILSNQYPALRHCYTANKSTYL